MLIQLLLFCKVLRYGLQQVLPLPKADSMFLDEHEDPFLQGWLDRLGQKKLPWEQFLVKIGNPLAASRLVTSGDGLSLLHLAVLDNRLDVIQVLKKDPTLKLRRNAFGLNSIEISQFLNRKEALQILHPLSEMPRFPNLPKLEHFEYLSHPVFETREAFEQVLAWSAKAKREDKIPAEKIWMGIYFEKEVRKGIHPPVSIRHIDDEVGFGVFADKKIPPCSYVGEYTGVIQQRTPKQLKENCHCLRYTIWEGKKNFAINAEEKGNFTRFINHSAKPNLGVQSIYWRGIPRMIFVALKEIREGGQLTFDYGTHFWKQCHQTPKDLKDDF